MPHHQRGSGLSLRSPKLSIHRRYLYFAFEIPFRCPSFVIIRGLKLQFSLVSYRRVLDRIFPSCKLKIRNKLTVKNMMRLSNLNTEVGFDGVKMGQLCGKY